MIARSIAYADNEALISFKSWLTSEGAEVLPCTGEWEVLRFRCGTSIGVAYKSKKSGGRVSNATKNTKTAWQAFKSGKPIPFVGKPKRVKRTKRQQVERAIEERDGVGCWFCGSDWNKKHEKTLEHLVPISHGGPNHLSNLVLACGGCNKDAGHLSVSEKVALREAKRK